MQEMGRRLKCGQRRALGDDMESSCKECGQPVVYGEPVNGLAIRGQITCPLCGGDILRFVPVAKRLVRPSVD